MSYEYKKYFVDGIVEGVETYEEEAVNELDEVYAKAKAFDQVLKSYDKEENSYSEIGEDVIGIVNSYRKVKW